MKNFLIKNNITIKKALIGFSNASTNTLIVVDNKDRYLGTLSSGDVRRSILKTKKLESKITSIFNKKSKFFYEDEYNLRLIKKTFIEKKFEIIAIISRDQKVKKVLKIIDILKQEKSNNKKIIRKTSAVIMAGGLGTRMFPLTEVLPKPLIPINGKPVLKYILESFKNYGINTFWLTLNHKSLLIKAYLNELKYDLNVKYYEETKALGTVGALKYLSNKLENDFFLTNCDTIINANLSDVLKFHQKNKNQITIVASLKEFNIPYGVCEMDSKEKFLQIDEKPNMNFLVNTGFYILNKNILKLIPNKKYDMTDLLKQAKGLNKKIGIYPIDEKSWIDIGNWHEYKKAVKGLE